MAGFIQIFGTSIMKATLLDTKTKHYRFTAPQWMKRFEAQFPVQVSNYAKFGSTIEKGRRILQTRLPQLPSHSHALLEFGGNDCDFNWQTIAEAPDREHTPYTPLSRFTALYRQMIQSLRAHHISPILLTLPPIDADRYFAWFTQKGGLDQNRILRWLGDVQMIYRYQELYSETVIKLAYQTNCPLVDVRSAFLDKRNYRDLLCEDGIHPNENGYRLVYDALLCDYQTNTQYRMA